MTVEAFKKYYETYYSGDLTDLEEIEEEIKEWSLFRNKILNEGLTGIEYNSTKDVFDKNSDQSILPCSLRQFIENGTPALGGYGAMVSGKMVLWIDGNAVWHSRKKETGNNLGDTILERLEDKEKAVKEINDYLKKIIQCYKFEDLVKFITSEDTSEDAKNLTKHYGSRNFIEKIITLNSWLEYENLDVSEKSSTYGYHKQLIFIYKFNNIEKSELYAGKTNILDDLADQKDNLEKNKILTEKILEALEIKEPSIQDLVKIQRCLWSLTESKDTELILSNEKKNIIFYGAPGTGKTYSVKKALESDSNNIVCKWVQFHPSFTYEDFIEGIKPIGIDANGNLKLSIVNGCFKDFCIQAKNDSKKEYYFIADEVNRANLSSVFGETLSLLENSYRWNKEEGKSNVCSTPLSSAIKKMYQDAKNGAEKDAVKKLIFDFDGNGNVVFGIPENVHFIGMMNDVDKSIDTFDLALRRRFVWIRKDFDESVIRQHFLEMGVKNENVDAYINKCKLLNYFITGEKYGNENITQAESLNLGKTFEIGHAIFMNVDNRYTYGSSIRNDAYPTLWSQRLEPTLREYFRSMLPENEIDSNLKKARKIFCEN